MVWIYTFVEILFKLCPFEIKLSKVFILLPDELALQKMLKDDTLSFQEGFKLLRKLLAQNKHPKSNKALVANVVSNDTSEKSTSKRPVSTLLQEAETNQEMGTNKSPISKDTTPEKTVHEHTLREMHLPRGNR